MTMSDGRPLFALQCLRCGYHKGNVRQASLTGIQRLKMQPFDEELREQWRERQRARLEDLKREESCRWWDEYNAYLASPEWKAIRIAVLERDGYLCQGCRKRRADQVHHLTYARKGKEMLFDLTSVCDLCHTAIHSEGGDIE